MPATKIRCPKCKKLVPKQVLRLTHGKCNKCGFSLASSFAKFTSPRSRIRSRYS